MAHAEGGDTRALGKKGGEQSPCLPRPQPCCSRRPLVGLCGGLHVSKPLFISHPHTQERSCREHSQGAQPPVTTFSPSGHRATGGGGGEGKEALSWLWSLLLDALVLHKAGEGLQSSPQQAPGSQDHRGFFLSDNQSGEQSQPPPVSAPPQPEAPAQPPAPSQVLPNLPPLGEASPVPSVSGEGLPP